MSNASRPTYFPAMGRPESTTIKTSYTSAKDQAGQTTLKYRQTGQSTSQELKAKDFKADLQQKEQKFLLEKDKTTAWMAKEESKVNVSLLLKDKPEIDLHALKVQYDDEDVVLDNRNSDSDGFDSSSEEEDDEDDDEDELQAELERIRAERAAAQAKKLAEEQAIQTQTQKEAALKSNPLTPFDDSTAKIKRRWNDDVVFRNQAKDEPQHKKRFINDTIRSDFHRSFLKKFIK